MNELKIIQNALPLAVAIPMLDDQERVIAVRLLDVVAWQVLVMDDCVVSLPVTLKTVSSTLGDFDQGLTEVLFRRDTQEWNDSNIYFGTGKKDLIDHFQNKEFVKNKLKERFKRK